MNSLYNLSFDKSIGKIPSAHLVSLNLGNAPSSFASLAELLSTDNVSFCDNKNISSSAASESNNIFLSAKWYATLFIPSPTYL